MAITVTATPGTGTSGALLRVLVLTSATAAGGANSTTTSTGTGGWSLTPGGTNSYPVWAVTDLTSSTAFTARANNTLRDTFAATVGFELATGNYSGTVTSGTPITVGATLHSGDSCFGAAYEILASGGSTPSLDGSSPAVVDEASGATALTTASFSPPAGSVVVAICTAADFPSTAWTVHDSSSMTWTSRVTNGSSMNIFTATVAAGTTVTIAGAGNAVATGAAKGATTKPVSAAQQAVAAGSAAGASTKPVTATRPAVAAITASASVTPPTVNVSAASAAVATRRAAGQSTKPASGSGQATATGAAQAASTKPVSASRPVVAAISASASVSLDQPLVVQQVSGGDTSDYGLSSVPITTTAGNGIVVYAGWDLHNAPTTGPVPAVYVADSAGNYWYHLGTSPVGGYGSRCAIWACPNARAVEWVSVALTAFASSLAYLVVEISNFPDFLDLDVEADGFVNAGIPSMQAFTSAGSGKWIAQPGVSSVNAQCWAPGGGGQGATQGVSPQGGAGGGGGEYAQEASLAVTAGTSYLGAAGASGGGAVAPGASAGRAGSPPSTGTRSPSPRTAAAAAIPVVAAPGAAAARTRSTTTAGTAAASPPRSTASAAARPRAPHRRATPSALTSRPPRWPSLGVARVGRAATASPRSTATGRTAGPGVAAVVAVRTIRTRATAPTGRTARSSSPGRCPPPRH